MNNPLAPARGILIGLLIGALAWLLLFAVVFDWFGTSVMSELGRRAVDAGVIP